MQPLLKMKENHATSPSNLPYLYLDTPPYPNSKYPSLPFSTSSIPDASSVCLYSAKYSARWVENVFFPTLNYKYILLQH